MLLIRPLILCLIFIFKKKLTTKSQISMYFVINVLRIAFLISYLNLNQIYNPLEGCHNEKILTKPCKTTVIKLIPTSMC